MVYKTKSRYPVSVTEVKQHLRIDLTNNEDDDYIANNIIKSATRKAENFIDKDITYTSNTYTVDDFVGSWIKVAEGNLISVDNIISDTSTLLTYTELVKNDDNFQLEFSNSIEEDPLTIQFKTGYDPVDCPEDIKQAILILCGEFYDVDRSGYVGNNIHRTDIVERLLFPYKTIRW